MIQQLVQSPADVRQLQEIAQRNPRYAALANAAAQKPRP
jgi:hypothetical protein